MEEHKVSLSRSDAFRTMPIRHQEGGLDARLLASMRTDGMLADESEVASRERMIEAQYGPHALKGVMNPRYYRDREGKNFRVVQQLDGVHMNRKRKATVLWPLDPDAEEKEGDMVGMLRAAVTNSEAERNKYLTPDQAKSRTVKRG